MIVNNGGTMMMNERTELHVTMENDEMRERENLRETMSMTRNFAEKRICVKNLFLVFLFPSSSERSHGAGSKKDRC